jgi:hypothetical protein
MQRANIAPASPKTIWTRKTWRTLQPMMIAMTIPTFLGISLLLVLAGLLHRITLSKQFESPDGSRTTLRRIKEYMMKRAKDYQLFNFPILPQR